MNDVDPQRLVETRSKTHGDVGRQARFVDQMMAVWEGSPNWRALDPELRLVIRYEVLKNARIATGDFRFLDHWADKGGYNRMATNHLTGWPEAERFRPPPRLTPEEIFRPGTPEDGGHHARQAEEDTE